jgi:hypothetical protein
MIPKGLVGKRFLEIFVSERMAKDCVEMGGNGFCAKVKIGVTSIEETDGFEQDVFSYGIRKMALINEAT